MKATVYKFTITGQQRCNVMKIIAHDPAAAVCTGLRASAPINGPVRIVCKPVRRIP